MLTFLFVFFFHLLFTLFQTKAYVGSQHTNLGLCLMSHFHFFHQICFFIEFFPIFFLLLFVLYLLVVFLSFFSFSFSIPTQNQNLVSSIKTYKINYVLLVSIIMNQMATTIPILIHMISCLICRWTLISVIYQVM